MTDVGVARKALDGQPRRRGRRRSPPGWPRSATPLGDVAADLARYLDRLDAEPGRLEWIAGAALRPARGSPASTGPPSTRCWPGRPTRPPGWPTLELLRRADRRARRAADGAGRRAGRPRRPDRRAARTRGRRGVRGPGAGRAGGARHAARPAGLHASPRPSSGPHGADHVELLFSANPGSEPRSLAKVASGGELSRVRLALEVVLAAGTEHQTLVFDEVDAGVGGRVAVEIGRRLAALARHAQVVVVTHLAQVAAFADQHYVVVKADDGQVTTSGVLPVAEGERAAELARMMAGLETTDSALAHAGELVELAAAVRRRRLSTPRRGPAPADGAARAARRTGRGGRLRARIGPDMRLPAPLRRRGAPAEIGGVARLDRRTKNLTKRLRPGEIAIIHHSDLDRVSAEALVAAGVSAVVNAVPSVSGRYPNLGPGILLEAGIPLIDDGRRGRSSPPVTGGRPADPGRRAAARPRGRGRGRGHAGHHRPAGGPAAGGPRGALGPDRRLHREHDALPPRGEGAAARGHRRARDPDRRSRAGTC